MRLQLPPRSTYDILLLLQAPTVTTRPRTWLISITDSEHPQDQAQVGEAPSQDAPGSAAGVGEAGPAGAAAPGQNGDAQQPQRLPRGLQEANPYRSLGPHPGGGL